MNPVEPVVNQVFRNRAGHILAALVRHLGPGRLDLAEEVLQDAFLKALEVWSWRGVPENLEGWLYTVARRRAVDLLRREARARPLVADGMPATIDNPDLPELFEPVPDAQLRLMFICCHPDLPRRGAVALTLRTVGGFGVHEIARAFLARESAVAQQLVRVKRQVAALRLPFELPAVSELAVRRARVLEVLYLILTEGHASTAGDALVREDLCRTAVRLSRLLAETESMAAPEVDALLALCCLQASRAAARSEGGALRLLAEQDRRQWDQALIAEGMAALSRAARGADETAYHIEAALAAAHVAPSAGQPPDWSWIVALYDRLLLRKPTAVVRLNRAIAVAERDGAIAGLGALREIEHHPSLKRHLPLFATIGELRWRSGDLPGARVAWRRALELGTNGVERRYLESRLRQEGLDTPLSTEGGRA